MLLAQVSKGVSFVVVSFCQQFCQVANEEICATAYSVTFFLPEFKKFKLFRFHCESFYYDYHSFIEN